MSNLIGKVAIVTGAAGGLGRGFALRLAKLGADVAILDLDMDVSARAGERLTAATVMDEVRALGRRCIGIEVDLSQRNSASAAIEQAANELGGIDILVNNAGGAITPPHRSKGADCPIEDTQRLFDANFYTMLNCTQATIPHLRARGSGVIINLVSATLDNVTRGGASALYVTAKAAVLRYSKGLAVELAPDAIRVNCISPGLIATQHALADGGPGFAEAVAQIVPLRRIGEVEDVANVLEFLATDLSSYVTGECVRVTGGLTLMGPV